MQESLKNVKQIYLAQLKAKVEEIKAKKQALIEEKFATKKEQVKIECEKLDKALASYIEQKQSKFDDEIAQKRQEVANKKTALELNAKSDAEREAEAEVYLQLQEFESEIRAIEKELIK